ncbi:hypothetical protein VPHD480_0316 [Vibrio phage D480]
MYDIQHELYDSAAIPKSVNGAVQRGFIVYSHNIRCIINSI